MPDIAIKWKTDDLPTDVAGAEDQIRAELRDLMEDTEIKNLFFHTVFLGKTMDDESVFVTPTEGEDMSVDCWYSEKTVWTSMGGLDDIDAEMVGQARDAMTEGPLPGYAKLVDGEI